MELEGYFSMATANIEIVGPGEFPLVRDLYNQIFRPGVDVAYFTRRLEHRHNVLVMVAELDGQPVGFSCGYELRPTTYYSWLAGVLPDARRLGVATQLLLAEQSWAKQQGYEMARLECYNHHKALLLLAIRIGFEIVGLRHDTHMAANLIIFEKNLQQQDD